jgi:hypothetical protein
VETGVKRVLCKREASNFRRWCAELKRRKQRAWRAGFQKWVVGIALSRVVGVDAILRIGRALILNCCKCPS